MPLFMQRPFILLFFLLSSPDGRLVAWCVIGFCVGIFLFVRGFRLLQRRHLILDTPVSKIRSASMGTVELSGLAVGPYTMVAPITERPCYYYRTVAWEWKQSGKNKQWVKVAAECMHVPFFLDDNTGKVLVDPRGADLDLHLDFQQEFCDSFFTTKSEAPANVCSFLQRHGVSTSNKIKVEEYCIKPKNALFLLGTLGENYREVTPLPIRDDEAISLNDRSFSFSLGGAAISLVGADTARTVETAPLGDQHIGNHSLRELGFDKSDLYRKGYSRSAQTAHDQVINLSPEPAPAKSAEMTQQQKIAAALSKAGVQSPAAWAAAGVTQVSATVNQGSNAALQNDPQNGGVQGATPPAGFSGDFDPHPPVVLMKGKNNPTFLISWRSQRDLARALGWKCTLMIWGGPALSLLSLYGLHTLTNWF